ncbi:Alpha/Beta hydrolase protein [Peziza echinospora]|nr:Alpha/Beta hydrolase protein [Peziza echinospora]
MSPAFARIPHCLALPTALLSAAAATAFLYYNSSSIVPEIIESPRTLLPTLTEEQIAKLPYPPTFFPGSRWVKTPHGTMLVFEFGPETGRKVLLVHGISTPCAVFRDLVWRLVEEGGCRVILFDLFGRGWSDTPLTVPHDHRLYSSQITHALLSSPIQWLSHESSFSLIGYSLGGCLIPPFLNTFPTQTLPQIASVILLAPAGLLPLHKATLIQRLGREGYFPMGIQTFFAKRNVRKISNLEFAGNNLDRTQLLDVGSVADWQGQNHKGFLPAWMSSFKQCPIYDSREIWNDFRQLMERGELGNKDHKGHKVLVILGEKDSVVGMEDSIKDIGDALGDEEAGFVKVKILEGSNHDFVAKRGVETADLILEFWGHEKRVGEDENAGWVKA